MNAIPFNSNIDYRSFPQVNFPTRNINRNATQQSPQKNPKREFDYKLIQSQTQNLNSSSQSLSRIRSDTPITIRGQNFLYVGQMNGNQREGVGSYTTNELEYEGQWYNNLYHGFGKLYQDGKLSYSKLGKIINCINKIFQEISTFHNCIPYQILSDFSKYFNQNLLYTINIFR